MRVVSGGYFLSNVPRQVSTIFCVQKLSLILCADKVKELASPLVLDGNTSDSQNIASFNSTSDYRTDGRIKHEETNDISIHERTKIKKSDDSVKLPKVPRSKIKRISCSDGCKNFQSSSQHVPVDTPEVIIYSSVLGGKSKKDNHPPFINMNEFELVDRPGSGASHLPHYRYHPSACKGGFNAENGKEVTQYISDNDKYFDSLEDHEELDEEEQQQQSYIAKHEHDGEKVSHKRRRNEGKRGLRIKSGWTSYSHSRRKRKQEQGFYGSDHTDGHDCRSAAVPLQFNGSRLATSWLSHCLSSRHNPHFNNATRSSRKIHSKCPFYYCPSIDHPIQSLPLASIPSHSSPLHGEKNNFSLHDLMFAVNHLSLDLQQLRMAVVELSNQVHYLNYRYKQPS